MLGRQEPAIEMSGALAARIGRPRFVVHGGATTSLQVGEHTVTVTVVGSVEGASGAAGAAAVAARYVRDGERGLGELTGQFAVAIVDERRRRLLLARDRYGEQQLFLRRRGDFEFDTDLARLARRTEARPDPKAVTEYLLFNFPLAPRTFWCGVEQLPPGTLIEVDDDGTMVARPLPAPGVRCDDVAEALGRAVERDRPGALFHLSGGVDSSLLCHVAATAAPPPTITAFFDGDSDERRWARAVADELAGDHRELRLDAAALDARIDAIVARVASPVMASGVVTFAELAAATARHGYAATVSGIGGDHPFIGATRAAGDDQPAALFRACLNNDPQLLAESTTDRRWAEAMTDARRRFAAGLMPGLSANAQLERFFRLHFLQEHLRMARCVHAMHGVALRSPFLDPTVQALLLASAADEDARSSTTKRPLRALLRAFGSRAAERRDKQQMALSPGALARALAPRVAEDARRGLAVPGIDYRRVLAMAALANPSKLQARLLWTLHNLHRWFQQVGAVISELDEGA